MRGKCAGFVLFAAGCLAGGLATWFLTDSHAAVPVAAEGDGRNLDTIRKLRRRIGELEKRQPKTEPKDEIPIGSETEATDFSAIREYVRRLPDGHLRLDFAQALKGGDLKARMAKLEKENPDLHKAIVDVIGAHLERNAAAVENRLSALSVYDQLFTDGEDLERHQELTSLVRGIGENHILLNSHEIDSLSASDRRVSNAHAALQAEAVKSLLKEERTALLSRVAGELGCKGDDAAAVVETIDAIIEATAPNPDADHVSLLDSVEFVQTDDP